MKDGLKVIGKIRQAKHVIGISAETNYKSGHLAGSVRVAVLLAIALSGATVPAKPAERNPGKELANVILERVHEHSPARVHDKGETDRVMSRQ